MKALPLEKYSKKPYARKAVIFYNAAKILYEVENRTIGSWEASYYLLSHSIELSIKAVAQFRTRKDPPKIHDKEELAEKYCKECNFTDKEIDTIREVKNLNNGPGGLRYENEIRGEFFPHIFNNGLIVVERLLKILEGEN